MCQRPRTTGCVKNHARQLTLLRPAAVSLSPAPRRRPFVGASPAPPTSSALARAAPLTPQTRSRYRNPTFTITHTTPTLFLDRKRASFSAHTSARERGSFVHHPFL